MKLQDFQFHVNEIIVNRGYDYYTQGLVTLKGAKDEEYRFQVSGSDEYKVIVTLDSEGEILSSYCDCPYDYGPVCKHELAVYFELVDEIDLPREIQKSRSLVEVLEGLRKEQLVSILAELAEEDETLESRLLMRYSDYAGTTDMKRWIRSIVDKYVGRGGFIEYRDTSQFASELGECLIRIEEDSNGIDAVKQGFMLLEEAINAFQYADDSGGDIGLLVEETLATIETVVADAVQLKPGEQQEIFDKLLTKSEHSMFEGWPDFQITLLNVCADVASSPEQMESFRQKVTSMIDETSTDHYRRYQNEELYRLLYEMIERNGSEKEAEEFIHDHLQYSSFREQLIRMYLVKKRFNDAIELAFEGERSDENSPGLVQKWKRLRYSAYQGLSMEEEQFSLAKELFLDGDFSFYHDLKALSEDPKQLYIQLKQEVQIKSGWKASELFQKMIEEENDLAEMLVFVKTHPMYIETYADKLVSPYPNEIKQIFEEHILKEADKASNRKGYQSICRMIRRYGKLVGKQHVQSIVDKLRTGYPRKPAFLDELSKI